MNDKYVTKILVSELAICQMHCLNEMKGFHFMLIRAYHQVS